MVTHSIASLRGGLFRLVFSVLLLITEPMLFGQSAISTVNGTVVDTQENVVAKAMVTVKNERSGAIRTTQTDANGFYSVDGLASGTYSVQATSAGFAVSTKSAVVVAAGQKVQLNLKLNISPVAQMVTVNAGVDSIAAQTAPSGGFIEERSAQSLISNTYIRNFVAPVADFGEIVQIVPGAFTLNSNGVGLGQSKTYFRGFPDGDYDIDFDGVPFYDTNSPTHHSWAFFPSQWLGGVDFDRSPGSASTIGPTPFGGSIHLLSMPLSNEQDIRGTVSYSTWNTKLYDGAYNSGNFGLFGGAKKSNLFVDVHHMTTDGYQSFNYDMRTAGSLLYQYTFSPKTVLTGFSGVVYVNANAPSFSATRCQTLGASSAYSCTGANAIALGAGIKFLMTNNSDPVNWLDYQYNHYQVPTDFEYVGLKSEFGRGWYMEVKPYTYNYDNGELYSNSTPISDTPGTYQGITIAPCNVPVSKTSKTNGAVTTAIPCGVDKYNSYRKYGETAVVTQTSGLGVFRGGIWYEWARTDRHQYPSDPTNSWADQALPNFAEQFWTNSYQPFAEYELHAGSKLNITAGIKYAAYTVDLTQHADDGKTVGNLCNLSNVCVPEISNHGSYSAWLPSLDFNYRAQPNWSIYAQGATGSIVPPSSVYDYYQTPTAKVPNPKLTTPPKQQRSTTYQAGTVFKAKKVTLDADAYRIRFQNSYSAVTDTTPTDPEFGDTANFLQPSSITQGVEFESNIVLTRGLTLYLNGTAANAYYSGSLNAGTIASPYYEKAPSGLWVAQTPADTELQGLTYQSRAFDVGFFNKRVGEQRVDNGAYHNQAIVSPFSVANAYFNYTIRNGSHLDQTKIQLSGNNLLNSHNLTSLALTGSPLTQTIAGTSDTDLFNTTGPTPIAGGDNLGFLPGRSFSISVTFGFAPRER
jgi:iron complex outermembrane receptor protein